MSKRILAGLVCLAFWALTGSALSQQQQQKQEAPPPAPQAEKAKAPDKEVATPPSFGGGAAIKVPKAKREEPKTERAEKPTEAQATAS